MLISNIFSYQHSLTSHHSVTFHSFCLPLIVKFHSPSLLPVPVSPILWHIGQNPSSPILLFCSLAPSQYGRLASLGLFSCTLSLFMPIWKPFMDWMAA